MTAAGGDLIASLFRPFNWGGVLVMDSATADIPVEFDTDGRIRSATCLGFVVRHGQDVDSAADGPSKVRIDVRRGPPNGGVSIDHRLDVPSGALSVGDAEAEEVIPIGGQCRVSVVLDDERHAEHVTIWLTPGG